MVDTIVLSLDHDPSKIHLIRRIDDSIKWVGVGPSKDRKSDGSKNYKILDFFMVELQRDKNSYLLSMDEEVGDELGYSMKRLEELEPPVRNKISLKLGLKINSEPALKDNNFSLTIEERKEKISQLFKKIIWNRKK
mgnify:CR=1 FL=1